LFLTGVSAIFISAVFVSAYRLTGKQVNCLSSNSHFNLKNFCLYNNSDVPWRKNSANQWLTVTMLFYKFSNVMLELMRLNSRSMIIFLDKFMRSNLFYQTPNSIYFCWVFWWKYFFYLLINVQQFFRFNLRRFHIFDQDWLAILRWSSFLNTTSLLEKEKATLKEKDSCWVGMNKFSKLYV